MKFIVPKQIKIIVDGQFAIENTPMNMDQVITFERDEFNGIPSTEGNVYPSVQHTGVGNKAQGNSDSLIGTGFPSISFYVNSHKEIISWVFDSASERDAQYEKIVDFIK